MTEVIKVLTDWCDEHTNTLEPIAMAKDLALTLHEAGFAVVPVEPTQKMVQAACSAYMGDFDISAEAIASDIRDAVREAIKAAQGGADE